MSVSTVTIFPERRGTQTCVCIGSYISFTKQKQNKIKQKISDCRVDVETWILLWEFQYDFFLVRYRTNYVLSPFQYQYLKLVCRNPDQKIKIKKIIIKKFSCPLRNKFKLEYNICLNSCKDFGQILLYLSQFSSLYF